MIIPVPAPDTLNLADPEMSLVGVILQIIEHALLTAIEAHAGNVRRTFAKTTANRPTPPGNGVIAFTELT